MYLVLILDSKVDKNLLSESNSNNNLISQIKNQGINVDNATRQHLISKYSLQLPAIILKFNNFILIQEPIRTRVFIIE